MNKLRIAQIIVVIAAFMFFVAVFIDKMMGDKPKVEKAFKIVKVATPTPTNTPAPVKKKPLFEITFFPKDK